MPINSRAFLTVWEVYASVEVLLHSLSIMKTTAISLTAWSVREPLSLSLSFTSGAYP